MTFSLHPDLVRDCTDVSDLNVCKVLLRNCRHFPWFILVPKREGIGEWFDLSVEDQARSLAEVNWFASSVKSLLGARKMNIAALGNITPQLHIHVIARFEGDAAWPNPVWNVPVVPYADGEANDLLNKIRQNLKLS